MKVITNQGEYATVKRVKGKYYQVQYDNGKSTMILKDRCEELVPISRVKEAEKNLHNLQEKHVKVATEIHKLHFEMSEQIKYISNLKKPSIAKLIDKYRCSLVFERLEKILAL